MQNKNKPLLLRPSGKDYLWGGNRLNDEFEKNIDLTPLAETWECSTHPDGPSYVVGGAFDGQAARCLRKSVGGNLLIRCLFRALHIGAGKHHPK